MGRLVKVTIITTMTMVAIAAVVGVVLGMVFNIGAGGVAEGTAEIKEVSSIVSTLRGLIPANIVTGMVNSNIIGLVIFSAVFGYAAWCAERRREHYRGWKIYHRAVSGGCNSICDSAGRAGGSWHQSGILSEKIG